MLSVLVFLVFLQLQGKNCATPEHPKKGGSWTQQHRLKR